MQRYYRAYRVAILENAGYYKAFYGMKLDDMINRFNDCLTDGLADRYLSAKRTNSKTGIASINEDFKNLKRKTKVIRYDVIRDAGVYYPDYRIDWTMTRDSDYDSLSRWDSETLAYKLEEYDSMPKAKKKVPIGNLKELEDVYEMLGRKIEQRKSIYKKAKNY